MVQTNKHPSSTSVILSPNRSATWRQNKLLILIVAGVLMTIALAWATTGAWMIVPFAGFEIALLASVLYRVSYSTYQQQIITISADKVILEAGVYYPKYHWEFAKNALELDVIEPQTAYEHSQICLKSQTAKINLGHFLNQQDRMQTLKILQDLGLHIQSNRWWLTNKY